MNNHKAGLSKYLDEAMMMIAMARQGKINCNRALDALWELIVNLQYELNNKEPSTYMQCFN